MLINTEALSIDRNQHQVTAKHVLTGESKQYKYDKLILSMGAESFRPPILGSQLKSVFSLQTVPDLDLIQDWIKVHRPKTAAVIGGGFL